MLKPSMIQTVTVAFTGASGIIYGWRLLECLLQNNKQVFFTMSQAAHAVAALENDWQLPSQTDKLQNYICNYFQAPTTQLQVFSPLEWTAPIASGSAAADAMVICPCSAGCVAAIANGLSNTLLERAADVTLKENKPLILVPRESPLSAIHLENLLKLARLGVSILPAAPGFYHRPTEISQLVDFIVARILDQLNISHNLIPRWANKS